MAPPLNICSTIFLNVSTTVHKKRKPFLLRKSSHFCVLFCCCGLRRYHTVFIGVHRVGVDSIALRCVGQDAEGVAGVQHCAGFGRTKAHLVHIRLLNDLHLGDFVGKVAPVGLQVDDGPQLGGAEV